MASRENPPCAAELRARFGDDVSTVPQSRRAKPHVCPHGLTYWFQPQTPRWVRYMVAVLLVTVWLLVSSVAVVGSAWLALLCGAGLSTSLTCGVVMLAAATVCTWPLVDELVAWTEGGAS